MQISLLDAFGMLFRRTSVREMRQAAAIVNAEGFEVELRSLEAHSLAGGDTLGVLRAMQAAKRLGMKPRFLDFSAADLAGLDLSTAVPRVVVVGWTAYLREQGFGEVR